MNLVGMEQIIERLTREKVELMKLHDQEILIKDKRIHQLSEQFSLLEKQNNKLKHRYQQIQSSIICSTQIINGLLVTLEFDQSIDERQLLEDFKKLELGQRNKGNSLLDKSSRSHSYFSQQEFEVNPLETAISNLEKGWQTLVKKAQTPERDEALIAYYKQQISKMQQQQRTIRTQKKNLEKIHNQLEKSRHQISERINKYINNNISLAKLDLDKLSLSELKQKVGELISAIASLKQKIQKLQIQLYRTKAEYSEKFEAIKHRSGEIRQKTQKVIVKKQQEISFLRSEIIRKQ